MRIAALAFALVLVITATPTASAAPGDLSYVNCIGNLPGCAPTNPPTALNGVRAVVMSPDGRHLYAVGLTGLSHFLIDASGAATFAGCVGNLTGCTSTNPATALSSGAVAGLAVSADGRHLYVATQTAVSHLTLDAAGNATFAGCIGALTGCTPTPPANVISGAVGIAYKPGHLYVSSITSNNVSHFTINASGGLAFAGCIGNLTGCTAPPVTNALDTPYGLALAPNGAHLYATSAGGNIAHLAVTGGGDLAWVGCTGSRPGCAPTVPAAALSSAHGLAFSPDGHTLYAASFNGDSIAWMSVDAAGTPTVRGCLGSATGCTPINPSTALDGAFRLATTPDGSHLYVASQLSNAASHFRVGADGAPTFAGCSGSLAGCSPIAPANALQGAFGVAIRPNGADMYVASFGANAISRFTIEQPPPQQQSSPPAPASTAPAGIDADGDGFFAGQDCNDNDPAIHPGAIERKGNRIDENCDGIAEPFPTPTSGVVTRWNVKGSRLTLTTLQVTQQFPRGWKAEIKCRGKKCPFRSKRLKAGKVRRGASNIISSLSKKQRRFRAGQTVEVWISAPGFNTKVARYVLHKGRIPTTRPLCALPGQKQPQRTCG